MKLFKALNVIIFVFLVLFVLSCVSNSDFEGRPKEPSAPIPNKTKWNASSKTISDDSLQEISFDENNNGWVSGVKIGKAPSDSTTLYKTSDNGISWSKVNIKLNEGSFISALSVTNEKIWLIIQEYDASESFRSSAIIRESVDRGKTWIDKHSFNSVYIRRLKFDKSGKGMIVGTKFQNTQQESDVGLILWSEDFGKTWRSAFPTLTKIEFDGNDPLVGLNKDPVADITQTSDTGYVALSGRGKVLVTIDSGMNWRTIADHERYKNDSIGYRKIIVAGDIYWALSNTNLIRSSLVDSQTTSSPPQIEKSEGFYDYGFSEVVILPNSDTELISCGWVREGDKRIATIFYSLDGGKTWDKIYQDTQIDSFNKVAINKINDVVVVGEKGTIVSLSKL